MQKQELSSSFPRGWPAPISLSTGDWYNLQKQKHMSTQKLHMSAHRSNPSHPGVRMKPTASHTKSTSILYHCTASLALLFIVTRRANNPNVNSHGKYNDGKQIKWIWQYEVLITLTSHTPQQSRAGESYVHRELLGWGGEHLRFHSLIFA